MGESRWLCVNKRLASPKLRDASATYAREAPPCGKATIDRHRAPGALCGDITVPCAASTQEH